MTEETEKDRIIERQTNRQREKQVQRDRKRNNFSMCLSRVMKAR